MAQNETFTVFSCRLDAIDAADRIKMANAHLEIAALDASVLRLGMQRWVVVIWDVSGRNRNRLCYL